ncbi:uncharacterized protein [Chironomus tepperi]|uniref:uncharacterized protein n=1 Tax=Chironomus tepperi TaxID=113505 RepID=UPI00391F5064
MKNCLFAALLLGSIVAFASAQSESFDYIDSQGRCWRCTSSSCSSCPATLLPRPDEGVIPDNPNDPPQRFPTDRLCAPPNQTDCDANPGARFPTPDINLFWDCGDNFRVVRRCECDKGFDASQGFCVHAEDMRHIGCNNYMETNITKCDAGNGDDNNNVPPTDPTTPAPCLCIPFWPCRCNPCWHMPCRSCSGCRMMMG